MAAGGGKEKMPLKLAQMLRNDLHLISAEAKKKNPNIKEAAERGAMKLKNLSEQRGFSMRVLAATNDVVRPLLIACNADSGNTRAIQLGLGALQKLIQYNALPSNSVDEIIQTLQGLVNTSQEEVKVLQTVMLLSSSTETIKGTVLTNVLLLCFKLYTSRDPSIHNTANVAIRQIVQTLFDRLNQLANNGGLNSPEPPPTESSPSVSVDHKQLPIQVRDGYLIFQDLCFIINGDPPAWLPQDFNLDVCLGIELLEIVLKGYPVIFTKEKLFGVLLTERVCPLVIKLFSPSSKHRHIFSQASLSSLHQDKPNFSLHIRLLRMLRVLIKQYFNLLVTQCEIFLSMLVRFLDNDKALWQRTLAIEVLHLFVNDPLLLKSFVDYYDMQPHSTNVFGDMVDGIAAFIQSNIAHISLNNTPSSPSGHNGVTNNNLHTFMLKTTVLQYDTLPSSACQKPLLLEMLEKHEIPSIPEGYPLIVAMTTLFDLIKSMSKIINNQMSPPIKSKQVTLPTELSKSSEAMLSSSWSAILSALAILLDLVYDDRTTRHVLESFRLFIQLCGTIGLTAPRDACLTALCKCSLPPKYAMSLVRQPGSLMKPRTPTDTRPQPNRLSMPGEVTRKNSDSGRKRASYINDNEGSGNSGGVTPTIATNTGQLSCKNVECILGLLHLVHQHGDVLDSAWHLVMTTLQIHVECILGLLHGDMLDSAWHLVMTTLQHIVIILGVTPSKTSSVKMIKSNEHLHTLALVSNEKRTEISEIVGKLEDLFVNSQYICEESLLHLVTSLCQLSEEDMQVTPGKDICLFPIISLQETCQCNMSRISSIWDTVTSHITMLCNHSNNTLRQSSAEILTTLVYSTLGYHIDKKTEDILAKMLTPLLSISSCSYLDVREKQLQCASNVLNSNGQGINQGAWMAILEIISCGSSIQNDTLVRSGFSSLQLIVTDFLPLLSPLCLPVCIEVVGRYGLQDQDLNISLTSIGLLWNIADYLNHHQLDIQCELETLRKEASIPSFFSPFLQSLPHSSLPVFDAVWMLLFTTLSELCINEHSAIRKSAAQTLFSALAAHGSLLQPSTWQAVLWQVLFNVLEKVLQAIVTSSSSTLTSSTAAILIHHSRDTAQKQWAETEVIVLGGVSRVVQSRLHSLYQLDGFERAWTSLLDIIKNCTLKGTNEVAVAAMTSFQILLEPSDVTIDMSSLWDKAWLQWISISRDTVVITNKDTPPSQDFLVNLLLVFQPLYRRLNSFNEQQLNNILQLISSAIRTPISKDTSPFLVPMISESSMSSLQRLALNCLASIITNDNVFDVPPNKTNVDFSSNNCLLNKTEITNAEREIVLLPRPHLYKSVFNELLQYFSMLNGSSNVKQKFVSHTSFALSSLTLSLQLMRAVSHDSHMTRETLLMQVDFMKSVLKPLQMKFILRPMSLWTTPLQLLLTSLEFTLVSVLSNSGEDFDLFWSELGVVLEGYLFVQQPPSIEFSTEERRQFEEWDMKIIELLRNHLHSSSIKIPSHFLRRWSVILNRGSVNSSTEEENDSNYGTRENFSRLCFESLLQLSFMDHEDSNTQLALNGILDRSKQILGKYIEEERLSGSLPASRSLLNEVSLVLKSTTILIQSLKTAKAEGSLANSGLWTQVIRLYPVLIECVTCSNLQVRQTLKETLAQFSDLIFDTITS